MKRLPTTIPLLSVLFLSALGSLPGTETIETYRPLLNNSPFLTPAFKDRLAKSDATGIRNYQFVGYTQFGQDWKLCLIHKKTQLAKWIGINESIADYTLKEFTPANQTLLFEKEGITTTLTLEKPK